MTNECCKKKFYLTLIIHILLLQKIQFLNNKYTNIKKTLFSDFERIK